MADDAGFRSFDVEREPDDRDRGALVPDEAVRDPDLDDADGRLAGSPERVDPLLLPLAERDLPDPPFEREDVRLVPEVLRLPEALDRPEDDPDPPLEPSDVAASSRFPVATAMVAAPAISIIRGMRRASLTRRDEPFLRVPWAAFASRFLPASPTRPAAPDSDFTSSFLAVALETRDATAVITAAGPTAMARFRFALMAPPRALARSS